MPNEMLAILAKEKDELIKKLALVDKMIQEYKVEENIMIYSFNDYQNLGTLNVQLQDRYKNYSISYPIRKKIVTIIKNENRFLHVREIAAIAHHFEKEIPVQLFIKKISPALSILKNYPESGLVSIAVENSHFNTFWGSRNWMDINGCILEPHMYNIAEVAKNNREKYIV